MNNDPDWEILEGDFYGDGRDGAPSALQKAAYSAPQSIFALSNGYLGLRGAAEEGDAVARSSYVNGFYERSPICYGETAFGFARWHETMVSVPDACGVRIWVNGAELPAQGRPEEQGRRLDLRRGVLERRASWSLPGGGRLLLKSERFVSLAGGNFACVRLRLSLERGGQVRIASVLDAAAGYDSGSRLAAEGPAGRGNESGEDPRIGARLSGVPFAVDEAEVQAGAASLAIRTKSSKLGLGCALVNEARALIAPAPGAALTQAVINLAMEAGAGKPGGEPSAQGNPYPALSCSYERKLEPGDEITLIKYIAYERDAAAGAAGLASDGAPSLRARALTSAQAAAAKGFDALLAQHAAALGRFWSRAALDIEGPPGLAAALRFNAFHVFQAAGRDGRTNAPAKGLTGSGYEGHYFWDTEIYFLPLLCYASPDLARALLSYRIATLDGARAHARELGHDTGALFPWRTISGAETSAYFPAGSAQYHINADIAYALMRYIRATGDYGLLADGGCELLVEGARLWLDLGHYGRDGSFRIDGVTGPDEYSALVNNNAYTNIMARAQLRAAADAVQKLKSRDERGYTLLAQRLKLGPEEAAAWLAAAEAMRIPYDEASGLIAQDDAFLDREPWDFKGCDPSRYPLLLNFHPMAIYRRQVLKQPDLLLAMLLCSGEFSMAQKKRNYSYYEPLTTGDSSLSHCIMGVMAAEVGKLDQAWDYFNRTVRMDLDDLHGNAAHGAHVAAMGGSWLSLVYGFAGFRDDGGEYRFSPRLPPELKRLGFSLELRGGSLSVRIEGDEAEYRWQGPAPLSFRHEGESETLQPGAMTRKDLRPRLRAVIFDLDGVLADTARLHYQAWKRLADEEGWPFSEAANEALKGRSRIESLELLLGERSTAYTAAQKAAFAERKNGYYADLLAGLTPEDALPGAFALLGELRARGIRIALASASRNAAAVLERLGMADRFDAVADASQARPKPDPEIFLCAAEALGVRRFDCVGIEDAQAGIEAIREADMKAVGIGPGLKGAHALYTSLECLSMENLEALF